MSSPLTRPIPRNSLTPRGKYFSQSCPSTPTQFAILKIERKSQRRGHKAALFYSAHTSGGITVGHIPELHAIGRATCKARGEAAEAVFLAKAAGLGFGVAKAWGESERYDFILDAGHKLWRVQVKSARFFFNHRYVVKCSGWRRRYAMGEIDFIAVYIVPKNLWYVVPIAVAALHCQLYFFPQCASRSICEIYREAWCQMACPRDGAPDCIRVDRRCEQGGGAACPLRRN